MLVRITRYGNPVTREQAADALFDLLHTKPLMISTYDAEVWNVAHKLPADLDDIEFGNGYEMTLL